MMEMRLDGPIRTRVEGAVLDDKRFSAQLAQWFTGHFQTHDARFHRHLTR